MALQETDSFVTQRGSDLYQVESQALTETMQDTDLLMVSRDQQNYKVEWSEIKNDIGPGPNPIPIVPPVLTSVSLVEMNPQADPRFTNQSFVASASLSEDGNPVSIKTFDAYVEGKITTKKQFGELLESSNINPGTNATFSNQFTGNAPSYAHQAFDGNLDNSAFQQSGTVITWVTSGAMTTQTFNKVEIYSYKDATVEVTYAGGTKSTYGGGSTDKEWIAVDGPFTNITQIKLTDTSNSPTWSALRIDGEILIDDTNFGAVSQLNFASDADMEALAPGDTVNQGGGIAARTWSDDLSSSGTAYGNTTSAFNGNLSNAFGGDVADLLIWSTSEYPITTQNIQIECLASSIIVNYTDGAQDNLPVSDSGNKQSFDLNGKIQDKPINSIVVTHSTVGPYVYGYTIDGEIVVDGVGIVDDGAAGTVGSVTDQTVTLSDSSGSWVNGEPVTGPEKIIVLESAKKYLEFGLTGSVTGLSDTPQDPPYQTEFPDPELTLTFPDEFPSRNTPDQELGEGTTLTVEITASNTEGSSGPLSATVQPVGAPPPEPDPTELDEAKAGLVTLYTGTGSQSTVNTGLDIESTGGMYWIKNRDGTFNHTLVDTERGASNILVSNASDSAFDSPDIVRSFTSDGFEVVDYNQTNKDGDGLVAWGFPKAAGYFDIVVYNAANPQGEVVVPHNLGVEPGCVIIKCTQTTGTSWMVYHKSLGSNKYLNLNEGNKEAVMNPYFLTATNTTITLFPATWSNTPGEIYVAYLFAEDTPDMIKCGSYTGNGGMLSVDTVFEPQWVLIKRYNDNGDWFIFDNKRKNGDGFFTPLYPNLNAEELTTANYLNFESTGFRVDGGNPDYAVNGNGDNYIYIAIAAPPPPEPPIDALNGLTKLYQGTGTDNDIINGIDLVNNDGLVWTKAMNASYSNLFFDTVRGTGNYLASNNSGEQYTDNTTLNEFKDNGFKLGSSGQVNLSDTQYASWTFQKAPGYFDVVEYTGNGSSQAVSHSLTTKPGLIITKVKDFNGPWYTYHAALGANKYLRLNENGGAVDSDWLGAEPTDTTFTVGGSQPTVANVSNREYIAYLFAEDTPGLIKCGEMPSQSNTTITTGFKPQWLLFKPDQSGQPWYIFDAKRGVNGAKDALYPNTNGAENSDGGTGDYDVSFNSDGFTVNGLGYAKYYVAIAEPPAARSLTQAEFTEQALKFATYQNRKEVIEGEEALNNRDQMKDNLIAEGYTEAQIKEVFKDG